MDKLNLIMGDNDISRLSRLTAILTQLQTKRLIIAPKLAAKFGVSVRTIYRDIKALEEAGVPILTEEGKGYSLMEGYRIPPVMFTESEANALITAEHLVLTNKDKSFIDNYSSAIAKIKAVLKLDTKDKMELLSNRIAFWQGNDELVNSNNLSVLQLAITHFKLTKIEYQSVHTDTFSAREIEPFALYNTGEDNWLLIAWCRLRCDFRTFRIDKILKINVLEEKFEPHKMTIEDYYEKYVKIFIPLT